MVPPTNKEVEALATLLESAGLGAEDLLTAISTLANAKKEAKEKKDKEENTPRKNILDKTFVYEGEEAIIYRRGDTKNNIYYFRCYDKKAKKQYIKSLGTTDKTKALFQARTLFQEIQGKIVRGERVRSITTKELIKERLLGLSKIVSDTPHTGITKGTYDLKKYFLNKWQEYIDMLGYGNTSIDRIPPEKGREFGLWFKNLPKETGNPNKPRSSEQVNNAIGEVKAMYNKIGVRDRFISIDSIPQLDRVKEDKDGSYKRDILTLEQYETFWKYLEYQYTRDKKQKPYELLKRQVFSKFQGILYNTGLRPKEALGLYWSEVQPMEGELSKTHMKVFIRRENSKNGKSRVVVAPIRSRVKKIEECYKDMGILPKPTDFVFLNPLSKDKKQYTRQNYYQRLKRVLELSGLEEELAKEGKVLSLYSSRHFFATMRLRYGKVPLYLLSKAMGTSVSNLTDTYGNISVEIEAETLTKNMGRLVRSGVDMKEEVSGEEEE